MVQNVAPLGMNSLPVNAPKTAEDCGPLILITPTPDLPRIVESA